MLRGPLVKPARHLWWLGGQVLWRHQLSHLGSSSYRLNMTHVEWVISLVPNPGRPHFGLVGPGLYATSSRCVILSKTTPGFVHNEDMYGFWNIWGFSVIWCSWNGRSTKLVELVSNRHLYSISCMKCRYVRGKYMQFMTANTPPPAHTQTLRVLLVPE
jgi:hypothetical protein